MFLLLSRPGSSVLVVDGFAGSRVEWSLADLLAMGYRVVQRIRADSWLDARDAVTG